MAAVLSNADPEGKGRVRVRMNWQTDGMQTGWVRVMTPDGGSSSDVKSNRGFVFIPEVGDQVLLGFRHGDPARPYVMGSLFNGTTGGGGGGNGASVAAIEAQIAQVSAQIAAANITAPIAGVVTAIYNEDRQMAIADRPFMLIQQETPMVASLSIPRDAAMKLASPEAKSSIKVSLHVGDSDIPGELTYIDTNQPENVPSVLVKATFNNEKGAIKAGEFYSLTIESSAQAKMLVVPAAAVRENQDGKYVYVLTADNTVDVRVVEVGDEQDGYVSIMTGLNEGEQVITTKGTFELGEKVKVQ